MTIALGNKSSKKKNGDIDVLKQRFAKLQQGQPVAQPVTQPQQPAPPTQPIPRTPPQQPATQPRAAPVQPIPQGVTRQQVAAAPTPALQQQPEGGKSPLDAIGEQPPQETGPVSVVEVEGQQEQIINQAQVQPGANALPTSQGEAAEDQTVIEDSLEELKEDYDDAKLNSIIIEQVKELIEIDTNLNNKIEDVRVDLKKEIDNREKLKKEITEHHNELKELEKSIDKFIALYELVTNQFNPFVKQGDPETTKKMQGLMNDVQHMQGTHQEIATQPTPQPVAPPAPSMESDTCFVTKTGVSVRTVQELAALLQTMSDEEFAHHVNDHKNDFSAWIHYSVKNDKLAKQVAPLRTKRELAAALQAAGATALNTSNTQQPTA